MKSLIAGLTVFISLLHVSYALADPSVCKTVKDTNEKTAKLPEKRPEKLQEGKTLPFAMNRRLSRRAGNVKRGRETFLDSGRGNCIACHAVTKLDEKVDPDKFGTVQSYGFQGDLGPSLDGVGKKYTEGELRIIIAHPKTAFPSKETSMPAYYSLDGMKDVAEECIGKTILTGRQIEDLVKYLSTLQ